MLIGYVYCYRNKITDQYYVGQTLRSIEERSGDKGKGFLNQPKFGPAIKEYGWNSFEYILLEKIENENIEDLISKLNYFEKLYINKFNSYENGYNCTKGGKNCIRPSTVKILEPNSKTKTDITITEVENKNADKKVIGACITNDMYLKLKEEANENFISISDVVRKIIYLYIKNKETNC